MLFAALGLLVLVGSADGFFHRKRDPASSAEDGFKRLGIERPEKPIPAPDFTLEDLSGKRVSLKDLRGKVVVLNFWATWCPPCRLEMPSMEKLHRELKEKGLEVVAVNIKETKNEVSKFFDELGLTFSALLDRDGRVSEEYGAWAIPLTYIIDQRGEFVGKITGHKDWYSHDVRAFFRRLLDERP